MMGTLRHGRLWQEVVGLVSSYYQELILTAFHNAAYQVKGFFIFIVLCQWSRLEMSS
jgi:hypothetical protein